ncbi:hypothetical protein ABK040_005344 [Willaertia magna]
MFGWLSSLYQSFLSLFNTICECLINLYQEELKKQAKPGTKNPPQKKTKRRSTDEESSIGINAEKTKTPNSIQSTPKTPANDANSVVSSQVNQTKILQSPPSITSSVNNEIPKENQTITKPTVTNSITTPIETKKEVIIVDSSKQNSTVASTPSKPNQTTIETSTKEVKITEKTTNTTKPITKIVPETKKTVTITTVPTGIIGERLNTKKQEEEKTTTKSTTTTQPTATTTKQVVEQENSKLLQRKSSVKLQKPRRPKNPKSNLSSTLQLVKTIGSDTIELPTESKFNELEELSILEKKLGVENARKEFEKRKQKNVPPPPSSSPIKVNLNEESNNNNNSNTSSPSKPSSSNRINLQAILSAKSALRKTGEELK